MDEFLRKSLKDFLEDFPQKRIEDALEISGEIHGQFYKKKIFEIISAENKF